MAGLKDIGVTREEADKMIFAGSTLEKRMSDGEFDNCPIEDVVMIGRMVANSKITSRWLERVIAHHANGKANPKSDNKDGKDYGDILLGKRKIGRDNVEVKSSEKDYRYVIGGGQHRFYEDIPYYLYCQFEQGGKNDYFTLYLLSKQEIHDEIFDHKVSRCTISQGSGKTKKTEIDGKVESMSDDEVRQLVQDTFDGKNDYLWGFSISSNPGKFTRKEPKKPSNLGTKAAEQYPVRLESYLKAKEKHQEKINTLNRWNSKYKVTIEELRNWENLLKTRYGI